MNFKLKHKNKNKGITANGGSGGGATYEQRQAGLGGGRGGEVKADNMLKNEYNNYGLSNRHISQQIASDLVQLNRLGGANGVSVGGDNHQLSAIEAAILRSSVPIEIAETEEITVNGQRGITKKKKRRFTFRILKYLFSML